MSQTLTAPTTETPAAHKAPAAPATGLLARFRARRAANAAVRQLRMELAGFDTPAAIDDLLAMTDRQGGADAELIRSILLENLARYNRRGY